MPENLKALLPFLFENSNNFLFFFIILNTYFVKDLQTKISMGFKVPMIFPAVMIYFGEVSVCSCL